MPRFSALLLLLLCCLAGDSRAAEQTVRFQNGAVSFVGTLELPEGVGPHAAILLLGGSDPASRNVPLFEELRLLYASRGIAAFSFDKRGVGESGGEYRETPDFDLAAEDGLAAIRALKAIPEIDSTHIGVWGVSQGGWLALLMASKSSGVAFAISVSGPGVSPFEQTLYQRGVDMAERGVSAKQVGEATRLRRRILRYLATGEHADSAQAAWGLARRRPWFQVARQTDRWFEALAELKKLPSPDQLPADIIGELKRTISYDPVRVAERVRVPVLHVFGAKDRHIPVEASVAALRAAFRRSGNSDATIRVFPDAGHGLQVVEGPAECIRCMEGARRAGTYATTPAPGFRQLLVDWVGERFGPEESRVRHGSTGGLHSDPAGQASGRVRFSTEEGMS